MSVCLQDLLEIHRHDEMRHQQIGHQPYNDQDNQLLTNLLQLNTKCVNLERDIESLRADKEQLLSIVSSLRTENEQLQQAKAKADQIKIKQLFNQETTQRTTNKLQQENDLLRALLAKAAQKQEESERVIAELKQSLQPITTEVARRELFFVSSEIIVAFSPDHFRVSGSTVTNISGKLAGCFTKPVSKGIHRLSIKTEAPDVMIGVCDAAECPKYLTTGVYTSPKAALMSKSSGKILSTGADVFLNTPPLPRQEWSAEADLEQRTLHFFVDGVQQPHHFINIPVPLVLAINAGSQDRPIEITFWGEETQSHVTFAGTGHYLGHSVVTPIVMKILKGSA
ncbi:hypothetical protein BLNAU_15382 [Blattamonas nauphoetae]|uniref:Uncharacterized protein n=1 Tax=Blattamonas nauphoetae TaxID=2049346 RepID=A0ABQ9XCP6_9EUKA|nr:hypothetical protein BLNAU_15382 [Blattamonas nauphoetae]